MTIPLWLIDLYVLIGLLNAVGVAVALWQQTRRDAHRPLTARETLREIRRDFGWLIVPTFLWAVLVWPHSSYLLARHVRHRLRSAQPQEA